MSQPVGGLTAIVFAPAPDEPSRLASLVVEVARLGAAAVRLPPGDPHWVIQARAAVRAATELIVLDPGAQPAELLLGVDPIGELHAALATCAPAELIVGGRRVEALLAGLAAGTHLRVGSADSSGEGTVRYEVQLVARAVSLSRLAGRPPLNPAELRELWRNRLTG